MDGIVARLALYSAGLSTGLAFTVLFTGGVTWYVLGAALVALAVGSAGAYRFVLLLPAAALYALVTIYGMPPVTLGGWRSLLERIGYDLWEAAGILYASPVPYESHPGLLAMTVPVVVVIVAFATSATLHEESPVISVAVLGLTIGVLSTVSFEVGVALPFAVFLASAIALLLLSGNVHTDDEGPERPPTETRSAPSAVPRGAWVLGAAVVGAALLLPATGVAERLIRPAAIDWTRIGAGDTSRLAVEVDVGDYLTAGRDAELLRVRATDDEGIFWRGGTQDFFDGANWRSTVEPDGDYGEEVAPGVETRPVRQRFRVLQAETSVLFGGYSADSVEPVNFESEITRLSDGSSRTSEPLEEGATYEVVSSVPQPTREQLLNAGTAYPAEVSERYLQLPENGPAEVAETAEIVRGRYDTGTPYDTARAVERYLASEGGFIYDLEADYTRADRALEEFLGGEKRGFCTQFATSMALILRELDVPTRVVYGATTGSPVGRGEWIVTGNNMHTWVEVYFPGVGWYPFDPTPGFSVPDAMQANAPRPPLPPPSAAPAASVPEPSNLQQRQEAQNTPQQQAPEPEPSQEETPEADEPPTIQDLPVWPLYALAGLLLLAVGPVVKRLLASRGRPEDLYRDLVGRLRDALAPGGEAVRLASSPALTPTERLLMLAGAVGADEGPFREFARAYSESLYGREQTANLSRTHRRALRAYGELPLWRRLLAALNPSSLVQRGRRAVSGRAGRLAKSVRLGLRALRRGGR